MNKKALYAVLIALFLPLVCYFIVKNYSEKAVAMPRHYVLDSVNVSKRNGKMVTDSVWHRVPDFTLVNQQGDTVGLKDLRNKIIIADFFFTHCPTICPGMTMNMRKLQQALSNGQRVGDRTNKDVQFISFSIDPERDSVPQLKAWADRFQIDPDQWWLLTGDKKTIYDLAINHMKVGVEDGMGVDTSFFHSDRFILIDSNRYVRGYYRGLDSASLNQLAQDLVMLTMEKDKSKKSFFAGKLQIMAVAFLLAIAGVGLFLFVFKKNKPTDADSRLEKE